MKNFVLAGFILLSVVLAITACTATRTVTTTASSYKSGDTTTTIVTKTTESYHASKVPAIQP